LHAITTHQPTEFLACGAQVQSALRILYDQIAAIVRNDQPGLYGIVVGGLLIGCGFAGSGFAMTHK
jgi:hypothetical protein